MYALQAEETSIEMEAGGNADTADVAQVNDKDADADASTPPRKSKSNGLSFAAYDSPRASAAKAYATSEPAKGKSPKEVDSGSTQTVQSTEGSLEPKAAKGATQDELDLNSWLGGDESGGDNGTSAGAAGMVSFGVALLRSTLPVCDVEYDLDIRANAGCVSKLHCGLFRMQCKKIAQQFIQAR